MTVSFQTKYDGAYAKKMVSNNTTKERELFGRAMDLKDKISEDKEEIKEGAEVFGGSVLLGGLVAVPLVALTYCMYSAAGAAYKPLEPAFIGSVLPVGSGILNGTLMGIGKSIISATKLLFHKVNLNQISKKMSSICSFEGGQLKRLNIGDALKIMPRFGRL